MIYLDTAATTPVRPEVLLAMKPYWRESFGNPGSITKLGVLARRAVDKTRRIVAEALGRRSAEIIFTSGGTESNNLAIFGVVNQILKSPSAKLGIKQISDLHFITTRIEHRSISECFEELKRRGAKVDYLEINDRGLVNPKDLRKLIKPNTVLVSVGYANNEIGTVQPIRDLAKEIRHARKINQGGTSILFHTDASQAGLYLNLNINELGVDMLTLDAQKIYGPKGVGVLYVRAGVEISPIIFGGGQEGGSRSGTENVPLIVGLGKALELARKNWEKNSKKIKIIRDYFWQKIQKDLPAQAGIPTAVLNGDWENRLPNNLNISIPNLDSEFAVLCLDEAGVVCSTRSACAQDEDGSAIVCNLHLAQGLTLDQSKGLAKSTLRFSLGEEITKKDINYVVSVLKTLAIP